MGLEQVFGENVRKQRRARGLSQETLAHEVDIDVSYLGQIERGERNPTLAIVERIATALQLSPLTLLTPLEGGRVD